MNNQEQQRVVPSDSEATDQLREAIRANVRAFRHRQSGEIRYILSGQDGSNEFEMYESVMIIPDLDNQTIDAVLALNPQPNKET